VDPTLELARTERLLTERAALGGQTVRIVIKQIRKVGHGLVPQHPFGIFLRLSG